MMVKNLRVIIIVDNEPGAGLRNSWGFSAYIEADKYRILFDADTHPDILEYNIAKLRINLDKVDFAVLSHHHHDHYGGFKYVGRAVKGLTIYTPPGETNYLSEWGLKPIINYSTRKINDDIWIIGPIKTGLWGIYEEALAVKLDYEGLVMLVGCSHPGVDNLAMEAYSKIGSKIYWVVGGFHSPSSRTLDNLARLSKYISPAHCSGYNAKKYVREVYPEKYIHVYTGFTKDLPLK